MLQVNVCDSMFIHDSQATRQLGQQLATHLPFGSVLVLCGPLGAGKTTLVQGLAEGLGFHGRVHSPTYTLIHEYPTPEGILVHADFYRLPEQALTTLAIADYLSEARLTALEWANPVDFPGCYQIELDFQGEGRVARIIPPGPPE